MKEEKVETGGGRHFLVEKMNSHKASRHGQKR